MLRSPDHHVIRELRLPSFFEDDLYAALDDLCARQEKIEQALFRLYLRRKAAPPRLFLYDVTSSYLEREQNELGEFGYNRDGKKGKLQIVIRLFTDAEGEPLAVRVFAGNTADPVTVVDQIKNFQKEIPVQRIRLVGHRGKVKNKGNPGPRESQPALHHGTDRSADPRSPWAEDFAAPGFRRTNLWGERQGGPYLPPKNQEEGAPQTESTEEKPEKLKEKNRAPNQAGKKKAPRRPEAEQDPHYNPRRKDKLTGAG